MVLLVIVVLYIVAMSLNQLAAKNQVLITNYSKYKFLLQQVIKLLKVVTNLFLRQMKLADFMIKAFMEPLLKFR
jgi:hypothetical protein